MEALAISYTGAGQHVTCGAKQMTDLRYKNHCLLMELYTVLQRERTQPYRPTANSLAVLCQYWPIKGARRKTFSNKNRKHRLE